VSIPSLFAKNKSKIVNSGRIYLLSQRNRRPVIGLTVKVKHHLSRKLEKIIIYQIENNRKTALGPIKRENEIGIMPPENTKNIKPLKMIEPVTTLLDDGKFLRILTELPGIAEEKIRIDLENHSTSVTIIAADTELQYKKIRV
jgi:hypothetical protein